MLACGIITHGSRLVTNEFKGSRNQTSQQKDLMKKRKNALIKIELIYNRLGREVYGDEFATPIIFSNPPTPSTPLQTPFTAAVSPSPSTPSDSALKRQENFIDFLDKKIKEERSFLKRIKDKIGKLKKGEDNIDNNFFNRMESALSNQKMYKNESE